MATEDSHEFGLIRSFGIDNGELEGLRLQDAFVLGYECAQIDHLIENEDGPFEKLMHSRNRDRVTNALVKHDRRYRMQWMEGDTSEEWMMLYVQPTGKGE